MDNEFISSIEVDPERLGGLSGFGEIVGEESIIILEPFFNENRNQKADRGTQHIDEHGHRNGGAYFRIPSTIQL